MTDGAKMAPMSASAAMPLRRDSEHGLVLGVAAGIARRLRIDPVIVRVAFAATTVAGGAGLVLYLLAWALMPAEGSAKAPLERIVARRDTWLVVAGMACLAVAALLLLRKWGLWFSDQFVLPVLLVTAGGALIWRQSKAPPEDAPPAPRAPSARALRLPPDAAGRAAVGAALVVGGGLVFLWLNDALQPARDVLLAVVVVVVALTLILAPWWLRLVRGLTEERAERIRSQERAEVAAHLHDSVLQTLALMQRRVDDPREVAALARRQERELRAWLNGRRALDDADTVASCLEAAAAEVEEAHGVAIDVVAVGDAPLDKRGEALVAATREALVNAAKFAGDASIALYAEVAPERVEVFVRDRGPGFEPERVPADRRGVRESIVGRMERHGGRALVHSAPGEGTEIELVMRR